MPKYPVMKGDTRGVVDTDSLTPEGREQFHKDLGSGAIKIDPKGQAEIMAQAVGMKKAFLPATANYHQDTPEAAAASAEDGNNVLRTALGGLPGAFASGGPGGAAAHLGLTAVLPGWLQDKDNADTAQSLVGGVAGAGIANKLRKWAKGGTSMKAAIEGVTSGAAGSLAGQGVRGELDPAATARDATISGGLGGVLTHLTETARRSSIPGISEELTQAGGVRPSIGKGFSPNAGSAGAIAGDLKGALQTETERLRKDLEGATVGLDRAKPKNIIAAKTPAPLSADLKRIQGNLESATTIGEQAYWQSRKVEETAKFQARTKELSYAEKVGKGTPDFEPRNEKMYQDVMTTSDAQLRDLDDQAAQLRKSIDTPTAPKGYTPESWMYGNVQRTAEDAAKTATPKEAEFMKLAQQRQRVLSQRDAQLASIVENDAMRLEQVKTLGFDKENANQGLKALANTTESSFSAIPAAVRGAMQKANQKGVDGVVDFMRGAGTNEITELQGFLKTNKLQAPVKDAAVNDFFRMAQDPSTEQFTNVGEALKAYTPDKLRAIFGDDLKAERFRGLAQELAGAVTSSKRSIFEPTPGSLLRRGVHALGSVIILGEHADLGMKGAAGAAGAMVGFAIPKLFNAAMANPALYHGFKDYFENMTRGVKAPLSNDLIKWLKENSQAMTPQEVMRMQQKNDAERQQFLQGQQQQNGPGQAGNPQGNPASQPPPPGAGQQNSIEPPQNGQPQNGATPLQIQGSASAGAPPAQIPGVTPQQTPQQQPPQPQQ